MTATFGALARRGGWLPLIGLAGLVGTLGGLAVPALLGRAVDGIVAGQDSTRWVAATAGVIALVVATDLVETYASAACTASAAAWLRNTLVRHVLAVGPQRAGQFDTGDLVSRVSGNAVEAARAGPSMVTVATSTLPPVGSLILLAVIDLWVAAAFLIGIVLVALVLRAFARATADVITEYQQTQGRIAARLAESLGGARTIAAAGSIGREEARVLAPLGELRAQGVRTWQVLSRSSAQAAVVGPVVLIAVLAAGGLALVDGRITAGQLLAASGYAALGAGLGSLTGVLGQLARARAGLRRAGEVLCLPPLRYGTRELPKGQGLLEFRDVTARDGAAVLLDGVDLVLPGGCAVAVVGHSGAGKSVLAALAARLREPDAGAVLLDGVPLGELRHDTLRAAVGCAFERPLLVGGTVGDAVGLGRNGHEVRAATRSTGAHGFVSRLPRGYDTPLEDAPLSGGEVQRLGLARAWHADRLLVLDDATSSLDAVTELQISDTLLAARSRTRLIVTHRVGTAARADLVVWLAAGRVRAVGPHDLLWNYPEYRDVFGFPGETSSSGETPSPGGTQNPDGTAA